MKRWLAIIAISLLLILFVYPSAFIYSHDTLPDNNDTRLLAYIIGQVQQNLLQHQPLYYGTFFAPEKNTLTYSDLILTSSLLTLPANLFTGNPILIFNLVLVLNFLLTVLSSYLLFNYLFKDHWVTTLTVLLFNFSGFHLSFFPHQQIFSLWLICLSLYFLLRFLNESKTSFLFFFFTLATFQLAESIFSFYLLFFAAAILFLTHPAGPGPAGIKKIIHYLFLFIPLWGLLLFPYLQLHLTYPEATRTIRDAANFSLSLDSFFEYHSWTFIVVFFASQVGVMSVFFSAIFCKVRRAWSLAKTRVYALQTRNFSRREKLSVADKRIPIRTTSMWINLFIFGFVMSLGPVLKIFGHTLKIFNLPIPLPYALFYYLFPGFTGFRTPSRFLILALLAGTILIGLNLKPSFKKIKTQTKIIFLFLVATLLFLEADLPLKGYPVNINMNPVYQEVAQLPPNAVILELPIKLWIGPDHEIESVRSLYTLYHQHRRFGGFSGFATLHWINLVMEINRLGLTPTIIAELKSLGITHIIQNNRLYPLEFLNP